MGRRKKVVEEEISENEVGLEEVPEKASPPKPFKEHHWSDDGPRYNVYIEAEDSDLGYRTYVSFHETDDLEEAKFWCLEKFEIENRTTIIYDRAEWNREIVRHEAVKEVKDDQPEPPKPRSKNRKASSK